MEKQRNHCFIVSLIDLLYLAYLVDCFTSGRRLFSRWRIR